MFSELHGVEYEPDGNRLRRRYSFRFDDGSASSLSGRDFERASSEQGCHPTLLAQRDGRGYWWYENRFYVDDEELSADAVRTRVFHNHVRRREQVESADRIPRIAPDVLLAVWDRDGGRCASCGGGGDLHFERLIPLTSGGSSEPDNLRVVCAACTTQERAEGVPALAFLPLPPDSTHGRAA